MPGEIQRAERLAEIFVHVIATDKPYTLNQLVQTKHVMCSVAITHLSMQMLKEHFTLGDLTTMVSLAQATRTTSAPLKE